MRFCPKMCRPSSNSGSAPRRPTSCWYRSTSVWHRPKWRFVIADAGADMLFVGSDFYPLVEKVAHEMKSVRRIIALEARHNSWVNYSDLARRPADRRSCDADRTGTLRHPDVHQRHDRPSEGSATQSRQSSAAGAGRAPALGRMARKRRQPCLHAVVSHRRQRLGVDRILSRHRHRADARRGSRSLFCA